MYQSSFFFVAMSSAESRGGSTEGSPWLLPFLEDTSLELPFPPG